MKPLDPTGWLFYCENCDLHRVARLDEQRDPMTEQAYFELVCIACDSVLLTVERAPEAPDRAAPSARSGDTRL
jgi:hypothetical protein